METVYGAGADPTPYIAAAYGVGALLLLGYAAWLIYDRRRLTRQYDVIKKSHES